MTQPAPARAPNELAPEPAGSPAAATARLPLIVWAIAAAFVAVELAVSGRYGFMQDELYFIERRPSSRVRLRRPAAAHAAAGPGHRHLRPAPSRDPRHPGAGRRWRRAHRGQVRGAVRRRPTRPAAGRPGDGLRPDPDRRRPHRQHHADRTPGLGARPALRHHGAAARPPPLVARRRRGRRRRARRQLPAGHAADRGAGRHHLLEVPPGPAHPLAVARRRHRDGHLVAEPGVASYPRLAPASYVLCSSYRKQCGVQLRRRGTSPAHLPRTLFDPAGGSLLRSALAQS